MQDIYHQLYESYIQWAGCVSDTWLITLMRITLLFAVPTIVFYWTFITNYRRGFARVFVSIIGIGVVLWIPLQVPSEELTRAWILAICVLLLLYLPGAIPFLVFKEAGRQRRFRTALYGLLLVLLLVGMIWS